VGQPPDGFVPGEKIPMIPRKGVWFTVAVTASLLESTGGKDKILKLMQYGLKVMIDLRDVAAKSVYESPGLSRLVESFKLYQLTPVRILASRISEARKLFRLGRSVNAAYMMRVLLEEQDMFSQVIGINSWFWNGVWFICDHFTWLWQIGVLKHDPLMTLNRIASVFMQVFQILFHCHKLALLYSQQTRIEKQIDLIDATSGGGDAEGSGVKTVSNVNPSAKEQVPMRREELISSLQAVRKQQWSQVPAFVKNLGDSMVCFDWGFQLNLRPLIVNSCGLAAAVAGMYIEINKAKKRSDVMVPKISD